jgi:hypothetical protein
MKRHRITYGFALLVVVLSGACKGGASAPASRGSPVGADKSSTTDAWHIAPQPDLVIGAVEGQPEKRGG